MPTKITIEERIKLAASRYGREAPSFDDVLAAITPQYGKDDAQTMLWHDLARAAQSVPPSIKPDFKPCGHLVHHRGTCRCKGTTYANRSSSPDEGTIDDIVTRFDEGRTIQQVAKEFGIAANRIRRYLVTRGVTLEKKQGRGQPFCIRSGCEKTVKGKDLYCSLRCAAKSGAGSGRTCAADGCEEPTFRAAYKYCGSECRERARNG